MLLAKSGFQLLTLVDDEDLTEENVARHLCGCHEVATIQSKVRAVKQTLERHLPYVVCDAKESDVLDLLINAPETFRVVRLVIFATGNMAAERRANDFFQTVMPKPVVYLWIEPFGVGGQVLYVSPGRGGCYRCCFDSNGAFRFAVAANGQKFARREAGCQTTFTPYGAADLEIFCAIACKEIIQIIQRSPDRNTLTTWIGDKEQFESAGFKISDAYAAHESYSLYRREVSRQPSCEICR
jgi:molybdopterin/thiamine biosynthesis adenylyltransferase